MSTRHSGPQVDRAHYSPESYDELHRWVSYWYQIQSVIRSDASRVLEIGIGSGVLNWYMRERLGLEVVTADLDPTLEPDHLVDVRELDRCIEAGDFDLVCAFQVLEHVPFADFESALRQLNRASRSRVVISLPNNGHFFQVRMHVWRLKLAVGRKLRWRRRWEFDGEHYWEVGTVGHQPADVRRVIERVMRLDQELIYPDYPYHIGYEMAVR